MRTRCLVLTMLVATAALDAAPGHPLWPLERGDRVYLQPATGKECKGRVLRWEGDDVLVQLARTSAACGDKAVPVRLTSAAVRAVRPRERNASEHFRIFVARSGVALLAIIGGSVLIQTSRSQAGGWAGLGVMVGGSAAGALIGRGNAGYNVYLRDQTASGSGTTQPETAAPPDER